MATYVMSDIHGCKDEFDAMLNQIQFSELDELWIIGDVVDRGRWSIPLLLDIMHRKNIHMVLGNHDQWLLDNIEMLIAGMKDYRDMYMSDDMLMWLHRNGGIVTADQFMDLPLPTCYDIKVYLEELEVFKRIEVHNKKYLLVHAGIPKKLMHKDIRITSIDSDILLWSHVEIDCNPYDDCQMIVGHVPTFLYGKQYEGKILCSENMKSIHMDCGCVFGRKLGCLRLDDMQEFYVDSSYPYVPI